MLYIAIALTLLALMGGVLLLWKVKSDAMGAFAKWMAYLTIVISLGMLLCEIGQSCIRAMHCRGSEMGGHHGMRGMQYCPPEMCGGQACYIPAGGCCMKGGGQMECGDKMECGDEHGKGGHDHEHGEGAMEKDSSAKN